MQNFKALLRCYAEGLVKDAPGATEQTYNKIRSAVPFIVSDEAAATLLASDDYDENKPLDLPFPVCSFEISKLWHSIDEIGKRHYYGFEYLHEIMDNAPDKSLVPCIVVEEVAPNKYAYYLLCTGENKQQSYVALQIFESDLPQHSTIRHIVANILKLLDQTVVSERVNEVVKNRIGGKNRITRISQVVRIYSKTTKRDDIAPIYGGHIDYSHRWTVRAHWRVIKGRVGKDRQGSPIENYTWVKDHIKGPEGKLLIKKTRILKVVAHDNH